MSGFNIADFSSVMFSKGVLRNNKFLVRINLPVGLFASDDDGVRENVVRYVEFYAEATEIPAIGLMTGQGNRYGYGMQELRPYNAVVNEANISFIIDEEGDNWQFFQDWTKLIFNYDFSNGINGQTGILGDSPYEISYKDIYVADIRIHVYGQDGGVRKIIVLRDSFPIRVGRVGLSWNENNSYAKLDVAFAFTDYYFERITEAED